MRIILAVVLVIALAGSAIGDVIISPGGGGSTCTGYGCNMTDPLPVAHGGTGSATQNFLTGPGPTVTDGGVVVWSGTGGYATKDGSTCTDTACGVGALKNSGSGSTAYTCAAGTTKGILNWDTAGILYNCYNGTNTAVGGGNTTASYLTATSEAGLSNEVNLGALATGFLKGTVSAGTSTVSSQAPNSFISTAAGTVATITNSNAALSFGTTNPVITLTSAGTYSILARVRLITASATFAANQAVSCQFYRTNNTPGAIAGSTGDSHIPVLTTTSLRLGSIEVGPVVYTTANTNDALTIYCVLTASAAAGSVTADETSIRAIGLLQ